jgi:hypothetical protein
MTAFRVRFPSSLLSALVVLLAVAGCRASLKLSPDDSAEVLSHHSLAAPDPSQRGTHTVERLYYGSGTDKNRPEYRDSVTLKTKGVDASKLVSLGDAAKSRNAYWGFTPKEFPLNGRVWMPAGPGPFPLVLIAHGNDDMKDFSDPGYAYLGELMASRGMILVSLDMNFVNGTSRENDARGWLFLKHLEAWRGFNDSVGSPLRGKVDMSRIALIGHSRGGEAVGHAAAFNHLEHYPDDANLKFDFGFDIRSLIAIAPVDGQYQPAEQLVPVENVNYLVFHGSHDGDVTTFNGLRQYQRVRFTDGGSWFKSAVYVYRANHGQWNEGWGRRDSGGNRSARTLDLRALLAPEDQRKFAEVYISAFLETTLNGDARYLPMFRDHRVAGDWLPKTMYITRFEHSSFRPLATFEGDVDVTTGAGGVRLAGDSLATWREGGLSYRTTAANPDVPTFRNNAVYLGWNNRIAGPDTTRMGRIASYTLTLPDAIPVTRGPGSTLDFLLMPTEDIPSPRPAPKDTTKADSAATAAAPRVTPLKDPPKPPVDLSVEVTDAAGVKASVVLSRYGAIRRPLETHVLRRADQEATRFPRAYELVLQSFSIPLEDFTAAAPTLDLGRIRTVRFVFDKAVGGTVILDDIGFSAPGTAFLRAERN